MTVTACDICGEIIERNVKEPVKGVCLCGKCLGTLAAMVMERNKQEEKQENDMQDAPIIPAENTAPVVMASGNAEYAEEYFQAFINGKVGIESFIDECAYVGNVIQCFKRAGSFDAFVRTFISKLGIAKDDVVFYQEQDIENSDSQDPEEDKEIENFNSQDSENEDSNSENHNEKPESPGDRKLPKRKAKVDHGKVLSLHNAGWTHRQIAEELGIAQSSVGTSLWKSRQAGKKVLTREEIIADQIKRNRII